MENGELRIKGSPKNQRFFGVKRENGEWKIKDGRGDESSCYKQKSVS